ncbi:DUF2278 family protein [Streptomyces apocyni]|uniref:DUF2278 family protein n=1 Tax=Streptomyces apocyni TaxID=2654677 RepID=UPI002278DFAA|nr:DUF2278 family protein [Streptomyces apocyni]
MRWKVFTLAAQALGPVGGLPQGYHELTRAPGSGALDFIRHPALAAKPGCAFPTKLPLPLQKLLGPLFSPRPWTAGTNLDAARALEPILVPGRRVLVFGEPFESPDLGMHNIHQNQGDPLGSQWWDENGIWQDGATLTRRDDGRYDVFLSKFSTQTDHTDEDGHPTPGS